MDEVLNQFRRLGVRPHWLAREEVKELPNILVPRECLTHVVMGWYEGGLALLCATNHRVLLIDKKLFFLTVEDLRYDMIAEVKYQYRLLEAAVNLTYFGRVLEFKSWNKDQLRKLVWYVRDTIIRLRAAQDSVPGVALDGAVSGGSAPAFTPSPPPGLAPGSLPEPPAVLPVGSYQTAPLAAGWPKNPYQPDRWLSRRHKISRFVTQSQLSR